MYKKVLIVRSMDIVYDPMKQILLTLYIPRSNSLTAGSPISRVFMVSNLILIAIYDQASRHKQYQNSESEVKNSTQTI